MFYSNALKIMPCVVNSDFIVCRHYFLFMSPFDCLRIPIYFLIEHSTLNSIVLSELGKQPQKAIKPLRFSFTVFISIP